MGSKTNNKDLKMILHPYIFVLKEGKKIHDNFLDYSLLILQVGRAEIIRSPKGRIRSLHGTPTELLLPPEMILP